MDYKLGFWCENCDCWHEIEDIDLQTPLFRGLPSFVWFWYKCPKDPDNGRMAVIAVMGDDEFVENEIDKPAAKPHTGD